MARGYAHKLLVCERRLHENFRDRLTLVREIVVPQCASGVRIIEVNELPVGWLRTLGIVQLNRIAPYRQEELIEAFLKCGGKFIEWHTQINRRIVDAGNSNSATLARLSSM
jgi:hypothetical protein